MPNLRWIVIMAAVAALNTPTAAAAQSDGVERFGLYVVTDDLDRASAFYEKLFEAKPQVRTAGLVGFNVAGGLYAVVSRRAYALTVAPGGAVRPYLKVKDIGRAFEHVRKLTPGGMATPAVVGEGGFRFFRFVDPDGNVIEYFSVAAPDG